jgi:hypothetical protein
LPLNWWLPKPWIWRSARSASATIRNLNAIDRVGTVSIYINVVVVAIALAIAVIAIIAPLEAWITSPSITLQRREVTPLV